MSIKVLIVDDEPLLRIHFQKMLEDCWAQCEVIASLSNGQELVEHFETLSPDVLFLDINMPIMNGLDAALWLQNNKLLNHCNLVFLTAYDQYAIQAFEQGAIDYLLKPLDETRLLSCMSRITQRGVHNNNISKVEQIEAVLKAMTNQATPSYLKWVNVSDKNNIQVVPISDVLAFNAEDKYTTVITKDRQYLIRVTIKQLEQQLDPNQFWRIHRASIIQVGQIKSVSKTITGQLEVMLLTGKTLKVSKAYAPRFKAM